VFEAVSDPTTNEKVFEIILKKPRPTDILQQKSNFDANKKSSKRQRDFHVFGEDTGDVLVVSRPGYNFDFNAGTATAIGNFFQPSTFFGQHGYDPALAEMKAIFYAVGPDFRLRTLNAIDNIDIAPTIADLLGIKLPAMRKGKTHQLQTLVHSATAKAQRCASVLRLGLDGDRILGKAIYSLPSERQS
jgi:predicted AlkP superfamily pyrophosphatase or phosphodiesterase